MCIMSVGVRIVVGLVRPQAWLECSRKPNATLRLNHAVNRCAIAECQCEKHRSRGSHFREGEGGDCFRILVKIVLYGYHSKRLGTLLGYYTFRCDALVIGPGFVPRLRWLFKRQ